MRYDRHGLSYADQQAQSPCDEENDRHLQAGRGRLSNSILMCRTCSEDDARALRRVWLRLYPQAFRPTPEAPWHGSAHIDHMLIENPRRVFSAGIARADDSETESAGGVRENTMIHVIGNAAVDSVMRVDRFPRPGETIVALGACEDLGGKGGNQAVAAARCGARVRLVAAIGDDAEGARIRSTLAKEGVLTDGWRPRLTGRIAAPLRSIAVARTPL